MSARNQASIRSPANHEYADDGSVTYRSGT